MTLTDKQRTSTLVLILIYSQLASNMPIYICPISHEAPRIPVLTNEGITYDFTWIARSLLRENTNGNADFNPTCDPTTNGVIDTLIYNRVAKEANDLPLSHEEKTEVALLYTQLVGRYPALRIYGVHTLEGMQVFIGAPMPAIQIAPQHAVIVESLWDAASHGDLSVVATLLSAGTADINQANTNGATPLYIAVQNGHLPVVTALLAAGADINQATTDGATPLLIAAQKGHLNVVEALLAAGANINQAMTDGATPLYTAVLFGHFEVVEALLRHQHVAMAHPPVSIATQQGYPAFVKALLLKEPVRDYYLNQIIIKPELMRDALSKNSVFFTELATHRNALWARLRRSESFNLTPDAHKALLKAILDSRQVPDETQRHPLHALFSAPQPPAGWFSFFSRTVNITLEDIQAYTEVTYPGLTPSIR